MAQTITSSSGGITLNSGDTLSVTGSGTVTASPDGVFAGAIASGVSVSNLGSIIGGTDSLGSGIKLAAGGTVSNAGTGYVSGYIGVNILGLAGSVVNAATILGDANHGLGVKLTNGGTVSNQSGGTISADIGVYFTGAAATLVNAGQIAGNSASGPGIVLGAGGSVINQGGTIKGQSGIQATNTAATLVNDGLIIAYGTTSPGINLAAGGTVTNQANGTISGIQGSYTSGVSILGSGTVVNAGSIAGTKDAVLFSANYANLLVLDPGAAFSGGVDGGNAIGGSAVSTLELATGSATGTLSGLGSRFINFAQVTVDAGATWALTGGNTLVSGATLGGSGVLTIAAGGTLDVAGTVASGPTIALAGTAAELLLTPGSFSATIGMQPGGTIVLDGITDATNATVLAGNTLEVSRSGGPAIDLRLDPTQDFSSDLFHVSTSGSTALLTESPPCYLAGTLIRTEAGEVPVEQLRVGDRVITRDGSAKPIRWIGHRSYAGAVPAGLRDVVPVSIEAGALADGVPARELTVSSRHALYLDDVLVPAERLVNGRSIRRRPDIDPIRYFHIELERHDVIFAEGAPAESFVDCDSRSAFHNAAEYDALYPGDPGERWVFCAPRVESGEALAAIRRRLDARARLPAEPPDAEPGPLLGRLDGVEAGRIAGWAFQPERPGQPVWLEVLDGDGVIARVEARRHRPDLEQAGIGDGRSGFELNLSGLLGEGRVIRVRRVADGAELDGSPLVLRPPAPQELAQEVRRLVAAAAADASDPAVLDDFTAELLQGVDVLRRVRATAGAPAAPTRRGGVRRALIVDAELPRFGRDAGSQAVLCHAAVLAELGWQVEFVAPHALADSAADALALEAAGYVVHRAPQIASVEEVLRRNRNGFDLVYLHRLASAEAYAPLARSWQSRARLLYSVADLHHLRVLRQAEVQSCGEFAAAAAELRVRELNAMRLVDAVITHSTAEAAYLAEIAPAASVHVVPWTPSARPSPVPFAARKDVACIGSWTHEPNVDAVRWLVGTVMQAVWRQAPSIRLLVAGSAWPHSVPWIADERVRLLGHVGSLDALLSVVRLTVAPLRFGAGLKGKVLDSLAAGVPAVMTPVAAEGFALDGAALDLVSDNAEGLAARIVRAHGDAGFNRSAADAGRRLVAAQFTPEAVRTALQRALGRLAYPLRPGSADPLRPLARTDDPLGPPGRTDTPLCPMGRRGVSVRARGRRGESGGAERRGKPYASPAQSSMAAAKASFGFLPPHNTNWKAGKNRSHSVSAISTMSSRLSAEAPGAPRSSTAWRNTGMPSSLSSPKWPIHSRSLASASSSYSSARCRSGTFMSKVHVKCMALISCDQLKYNP